MNSNVNRFANIVGQQYSRQVKDIIIPLQDADGNGFEFLVNIANTAAGQKFNGTAQALDKDGKKTGQVYTIGELTDPDPTKGLLMILQQDGLFVKY